MNRFFPALTAIALAALLLLIAGCSSTPDFTRYRVEVTGYLSGDSAICGSIALVDTGGDFRFGFTNKCFTFKPQSVPETTTEPATEVPPVTGE